MPDFEAGQDNQTSQGKTDIFRWPTLFGQNLNINLLLFASSPRGVYSAIRKQGILTKEMEPYFQFILVTAIVIRNLAYLTHGTQRELLSFLPAGGLQDDDRYSVPQSLLSPWAACCNQSRKAC